MLDEDNKIFAMGDKKIKLTKNETRLMAVLIKNKGKWTSTQDLINLINCNSENALRKLINYLNNKIKKNYCITNKKRVRL